jgi:hypothetical protein
MEHSVSQADNVASRLEIFAAYLEATSKSLCVIISSAGAAWGLLMKVSLPLAPEMPWTEWAVETRSCFSHVGVAHILTGGS